MSSISVRFNSFLFFYSIFNERKTSQDLSCLAVGTADWSVWMDSNHRPQNNARVVSYPGARNLRRRYLDGH